MATMSVACLALLVAMAHGARVKPHNMQQDISLGGCKKVLKNNYCPVQITDHLMETIGGKSEAELGCISEFCEQEADEAAQCCKVKSALVTQLQDARLTAGFSEETLTKLRNAVGVEAVANSGPKTAPEKPIWEREADKRKLAEQQVQEVDDSGSDEMCMCPSAGRGVATSGFGNYKKSQLFSDSGKCTGSNACNTCYWAPATGNGIFGCCLQNADGAAVDCAPEFKKPKFGSEFCLCDGVMGRVLKSTLFEKGAKHCKPDTACKICKSSCGER